MRLLRHLRRLFEPAPVKYVLLLTPVQDAELRHYLMQVGLGEYAPDVLVNGNLPACRTGHPYISVTGEVARDDTAVREVAATEFGREFRELDEGTHSFTTEISASCSATWRRAAGC